MSRVAVYLLAPQVPGTSDAEDEDVESMPSHLSQIEGDEDDVPDTDPATYTLKDVKVEELDMSDCVQKILEGLRGDAFCIARDIGLERLLQYDGIDHLVEEIRKQAFPLQSEEASELSRQGQLITGPLAKQPGEPMLSYIARRKRWWSTLRELDPDIRLSEAMRELSGLDRTEQLMIKTAARTHSIDEYAKVLVQHHSVMHMKERLLTSKDMSGPGRPWKRFPPQDRYPKFGYLGYDPESQDGEHPEGEGQPGDGYGYEGYPATAPGGASDDDWVRTRTLQSRSTPIWRWHPKLRSTSWMILMLNLYSLLMLHRQHSYGPRASHKPGKVIRSNRTIADWKALLTVPRRFWHGSHDLGLGGCQHWPQDLSWAPP